jgi:universal stress protein A
MSGYRKILVAVDLSEESPVLIDKARQIALANHAEVTLVHVHPPLPVSYALDIPSVSLADVDAELQDEARKHLLTLAASVDIPASRQHCLVGQPAPEIRNLAKTLGIDLIVTGGHGKHGLDLLLGSTSTSVAHGVSCDLLIVKLPEH